jgi:hypothetical protein
MTTNLMQETSHQRLVNVLTEALDNYLDCNCSYRSDQAPEEQCEGTCTYSRAKAALAQLQAPPLAGAGLKARHERLQAPSIATSDAFRNERPWCGWVLAFAHWSEADTVTAFGFAERLLGINVLLTTADGRSRPVNILDVAVEMPTDNDELCGRGITIVELDDTKDYEPMPERHERVRYEDIREMVVF